MDDPGAGWLDAGPPGPDDVQIVVLESDGGPPHAPLVDYENVALPITVRGEDFNNGSTLTAAETASQSVAHRAVEINGRKFEVFVTLGAPQPDATHITAANAVLATLRVDAGPPPTGSVSPTNVLRARRMAGRGLRTRRIRHRLNLHDPRRTRGDP